MMQKILKLFNLYTKEEVLVGLEFGLILAETAKEMNVVITRNGANNAEKIYIKELNDNGVKKTALNFIPLITTILEEEKKTPLV